MTINKSSPEEPKWGKTQPTKSPAPQTTGCKAGRAQKPCKFHEKITEQGTFSLQEKYKVGDNTLSRCLFLCLLIPDFPSSSSTKVLMFQNDFHIKHISSPKFANFTYL
jgi:hypothetical protein